MPSLWVLCQNGELDEVQSELLHGRDVNDKDYSGNTALMYAVFEKHNSIVKLLLDQPRVKINEKNSKGWTSLHYAALSNNPEGARMLLLHPTMDSANAKDSDTAVMLAVVQGHKEVLRELVKHQSVSLDVGNLGGNVR